MSPEQIVERGKPASYGQEITKRRARIVESFVSVHGKSILDFGCGNGAQTMELAHFGGEITGCDMDAPDIQAFQEVVRRTNLGNVHPLLYDGHHLPLNIESVDLAVCFGVLEHVSDEALALGEIRRVLKKGGNLVISVPNKWWIFETHGARLPLLPWNRIPFFSWLPSTIHRRFAKARIYRKTNIVRLLTSNGFIISTTAYMTAPMDVLPWPSIRTLLRKLVFRGDTTSIPVFSTEIFVHCQKPPA